MQGPHDPRWRSKGSLLEPAAGQDDGLQGFGVTVLPSLSPLLALYCIVHSSWTLSTISIQTTVTPRVGHMRHGHTLLSKKYYKTRTTYPGGRRVEFQRWEEEAMLSRDWV